MSTSTVIDTERLAVHTGSAQHIGKREQQQDAWGYSRLNDEAFARHGGYLGVLADGMGGMEQGVWAGAEAVKVFIAQYQQKTLEEPIPAALNRALVAANKVVYEQARQWRLVDKMGSTLVAAVIHENVLHWISAGDSRAYLVSEQTGLQQLTTDHSYQHVLQLKVQKGEITQQEAETSPMRSALTSFVGGKKIERIDQSEPQGVALTPGNWVLLCSDGLTGTLSDREILDAFRGRGPQGISKHLVDQVLQRRLPNQDNVSVLIMRIPVPGEPQEVGGLDTRAHYHIKSSPLQAITRWFDNPDKGSDTVNTASRNKTWLIVAVCLLLALLIGFWLVLQPKPPVPVPAPPRVVAPVVDVPVVDEPKPDKEAPHLKAITLPSLEEQRAEVEKQRQADEAEKETRAPKKADNKAKTPKKTNERKKDGKTQRNTADLENQGKPIPEKVESPKLEIGLP